MKTDDSLACEEERPAGQACDAARTLTEITPSRLLELLEQNRGADASLIAFDADGTLWTGDVSDDVFLSACREGWLLDAALPRLQEQAEVVGVDPSGSPSEVALRLFEANQRGLFDECTLFAMMTWCYAGRGVRELTEYAAKVLVRESLEKRLRPEFERVLSWARNQNLVCVVVSASPHPIVTWAASHWGFAPERIIGTIPLLQAGVIADQILDEVPFGANKCMLLKRRFPDQRVLASFGDSHFDFELLECAEIPVAVCPKPALSSSLLRLSRAVVLKTDPPAL